jgi:predicted aspartyl protease
MPGGRKGDALVDTGATIGALDAVIVERLQLRAIREVALHTAGGVHDATTYMVGVCISGFDAGDVEVASTPGLALNGFIALLGRNFLVGRTFVYNGRAGTFSVDIEPSENAAELTPEG